MRQLSSNLEAEGDQHQSASASLRTNSLVDELLNKRVRKFVAQLPKVLSEEEPEAVHDLRVASRRLQQVIAALFPKPRPDEAEAVIRTLKKARRAVAKWRDCDVLLELVEKRLAGLRDDEERIAWEKVRDYLRTKRAKAIVKARDRLANRKLFNLVQTINQLKEKSLRQGSAYDENQILFQTIRAGMRNAWLSWHQTLTSTAQSMHPEALHAFRIETKRLRYRIELALDTGQTALKPTLVWLRKLQDSLGQLHDRDELIRIVAKALASAEFLLEHPQAVSRIFRKLANQRQAQLQRAQRVIANAMNSTSLQQLAQMLEPGAPEIDPKALAVGKLSGSFLTTISTSTTAKP